MSNSSEHDVIKMIPSSIKTLLRNISRKTMKRTTRQSGKYYYRGKTKDCLRVIVDVRKGAITFKRELKCSYGVRHDYITYSIKTNTILKEFHEPSAYDADFRAVEYPLIVDESENFMQSLVHDKYFPSHEDCATIIALKDEFFEDVKAWAKELQENKTRRIQESNAKWQKKQELFFQELSKKRKSKVKPTSS